ncbi:MAG: hypothetical protein IJP48_01305 [Synergistaceae bacterium]|nr:hypothetical protein [Synergistaceae bacterium]
MSSGNDSRRRKNYYFVDYENTGSDGLTGIENLDGDNTVFIFYSSRAGRIMFDLHVKINMSQAVIQYCKVHTGVKNALDFQLASYLGYIIRDNKESQCNYFIVSRDNGYSSLLHFWEERGINIEFVINTAGDKLHVLTTAARELKQKISERLNDSTDSAAIADIILKYKTRMEINNALVKTFQSKRGGEIYRAVKTLITR